MLRFPGLNGRRAAKQDTFYQIRDASRWGSWQRGREDLSRQRKGVICKVPRVKSRFTCSDEVLGPLPVKVAWQAPGFGPFQDR